jgi:AraC family transcriptional regulator, regulatory protein of adaptative response / methylated-DNA-[protein]-cysteine methyltransferase
MLLAEEQLYWEAVAQRNTAMDGQFVYAVTSTGVFCRPGCPSRRPRRDKVRFFADPREAQRAGFRPCRRCRPLDPRANTIERVCRYLEQHSDEQTPLATLAAFAGLSPDHLQRKFKAAVGISPREYADACRMKSFKHRLRQGQPVTAALYDAGFGSSSRLYERSAAELAMKPLSYRSGGAAASIRYTIEDSPVGAMLIAATDVGVCAIQFADSEEQLIGRLKAEYPNASIARDELLLHPHAEAMVAWLRGCDVALDLPLDIRATAFQRLVWNYLRSIPYGHTRSYAEIAAGIGKPEACRAVARACAANPVAIAIPCHRVVRSDGDPGGYRWGSERKRQILAIERPRGSVLVEEG